MTSPSISVIEFQRDRPETSFWRLKYLCVAVAFLFLQVSAASSQQLNVTEKVALGQSISIDDFKDQTLFSRITGEGSNTGWDIKLVFSGAVPKFEALGAANFTYNFDQIVTNPSTLSITARMVSTNTGNGGTNVTSISINLRTLEISRVGSPADARGIFVHSDFGCQPPAGRAWSCSVEPKPHLLERYGANLKAAVQLRRNSGITFNDSIKPAVTAWKAQADRVIAEEEQSKKAAAAEGARRQEEEARARQATAAAEARRQEEARARQTAAAAEARRQEETRARQTAAAEEARRQEEARARQTAAAEEQRQQEAAKSLEKEKAASAVAYLADVSDFAKSNRSLDPIILADFFGKLAPVERGVWTKEIEAIFNELQLLTEKSPQFTAFKNDADQRRAEMRAKRISELRANIKRYEDGITGFIQENLRSPQAPNATALVRELRAGVTSDVVEDLSSLERKASAFVRAQSIKLGPQITAATSTAGSSAPNTSNSQQSPAQGVAVSQDAQANTQRLARAPVSGNTFTDMKFDQTIQKRELGDGFKNFEAKAGSMVLAFAVSMTLSKLPANAPTVTLIGDSNNSIDMNEAASEAFAAEIGRKTISEFFKDAQRALQANESTYSGKVAFAFEAPSAFFERQGYLLLKVGDGVAEFPLARKTN